MTCAAALFSCCLALVFAACLAMFGESSGWQIAVGYVTMANLTFLAVIANASWRLSAPSQRR